MKKRGLLALMLGLVLALSLGLTACGDDAKTPEKPEKSFTVELNKTALSLPFYGEETLFATKKDDAGELMPGAVFEYKSANDSIATVTEGGKVRGVGEGTTTITASTGGKSAVCTVTVAAPDKLPMLDLGAGASRDISVLEGGSFQMQPKVTYDSLEVSGAAFTYESSDDAVLTVSASGLISGIKKGEAEVTVKGAWKTFGADVLSDVLKVKVNIDLSVRLVTEGKTLKVSSSNLTIDGYTRSNTLELAAEVLVSGQTVTDGAFTFESSDDDVLTATKKGSSEVTLTGKGEGSAQVTVTYIDASDNAFTSLPVTIEVEFPVVDKTAAPSSIDLDATLAKGETGTTLSSKAVFGAATDLAITSVSDITAVASEITVVAQGNDAVIKNFTLNSHGSRVFEVRSSEYGVKLNVFVATQIILTAQQLQSMNEYTEGTPGNGKAYGENKYYILGDDIDASGFRFKSTHWNGGTAQEVGNYGFRGFFDGRGHVVDSITLQPGGIFGHIGNGAVIKNFGLTNVAFAAETGGSTGWQHVTLATDICGSAVIENAFIQVNKFVSGTPGKARLIANTLKRSGVDPTFKNCVLVLDIEGAATTRSFATSLTPTNRADAENVYVISKHALADAPIEATSKILRYDTAADFNANKPAELGLDAQYWDFSGDIPVFKTYLPFVEKAIRAAFDELSESAPDLIAGRGGEYVVPAALGDVTVTLVDASGNDKAYAGISVSDRTVTVDTTAAGDTVYVKIVSNALSGLTKTISFKVDATVTEETVSDLFEMSKSANNTATHGSIENEKITTDYSEVSLKKGTDAEIKLAAADFTITSGKMSFNATAYAKLTAASAKAGTYTVALKGAGKLLTFDNVYFYTEIITTKERLVVFKSVGRAGASIYGVGEHYILGGNIDASGYEHIGATDWAGAGTGTTVVSNGEFGFQGIFDGRGYTISNLTIKTGGLFGHIGNNAVIKNLGLAAVKLSLGNWQHVVLGIDVGGSSKIEDVIIELTEVADACTSSVRIIANNLKTHTTGSVSMKNCVMVITAVPKGTTNIGMIATKWSLTGENFNAENVHAISGYKLFQEAGGSDKTDYYAETALCRYGTDGRYATFADRYAADPEDGTVRGGLNAECWAYDSVKGYPVFKTMLTA